MPGNADSERHEATQRMICGASWPGPPSRPEFDSLHAKRKPGSPNLRNVAGAPANAGRYRPTTFRTFSVVTGSITPRSVMIAVISSAGVTSNAGA